MYNNCYSLARVWAACGEIYTSEKYTSQHMYSVISFRHNPNVCACALLETGVVFPMWESGVVYI